MSRSKFVALIAAGVAIAGCSAGPDPSELAGDWWLDADDSNEKILIISDDGTIALGGEDWQGTPCTDTPEYNGAVFVAEFPCESLTLKIKPVHKARIEVTKIEHDRDDYTYKYQFVPRSMQ